jgi:Ion transport protein
MTITNIYSFTCLLIIVIFCYALLGIEFFANQARINPTDDSIDYKHGYTPIFNFDSFIDSTLTVFVIFTNDEQSKIFYDYYRAVDPIASTLFWITFVILA